jgi:hypothetical protein
MKYAFTLCLIVAMPAVCFGTNQFPEKLVDEYYDERDMASTPLEDYFSADHPRPKWLEATSSACWRGYIGAWEIREHSLLLNSLYRNVGPRLKEKEHIPLKKLFGDSRGPVRAKWFSGVLRVLDGKRIMSMGFSPVNERDLFISVVRGEVIGNRTVDNTSGGEWSWSDQSWQSLTIELRQKRRKSLQVVRDADLEEEDWLDGRQIHKRLEDLMESRAIFNVRGLFLGTKLWIPPIRIGKNQDRDQYEFVRDGLHHDLEYVPNIDVGSKSYSRMVGTTVEITARFRGKYRTALLVSKVTQLPSGAPIQKRR